MCTVFSEILYLANLRFIEKLGIYKTKNSHTINCSWKNLNASIIKHFTYFLLFKKTDNVCEVIATKRIFRFVPFEKSGLIAFEYFWSRLLLDFISDYETLKKKDSGELIQK